MQNEQNAPLKKVPQINVQGVKISEINLELAEKHVIEAVQTKRKGYICVTGVHGVTEAQDDPEFRDILNSSFLNTPDGMPMVWYGKAQGSKIIARVYGPDLMLRICEISGKYGISHFFYGGKEGVAELLKENLEKKFPGLEVVGTYCPPFRPLNEEEEASLITEISEKKPDILWVGLSTPKQERFMSKYLPFLDVTLMFGVGAAFDFHAGLIPQAPPWMQKNGLEWLFRLCKEPRRLWKRYLRNNPLFLMRSIAQATGLKKYSLTHTEERQVS